MCQMTHLVFREVAEVHRDAEELDRRLVTACLRGMLNAAL